MERQKSSLLSLNDVFQDAIKYTDESCTFDVDYMDFSETFDRILREKLVQARGYGVCSAYRKQRVMGQVYF